MIFISVFILIMERESLKELFKLQYPKTPSSPITASHHSPLSTPPLSLLCFFAYVDFWISLFKNISKILDSFLEILASFLFHSHHFFLFIFQPSFLFLPHSYHTHQGKGNKAQNFPHFFFTSPKSFEIQHYFEKKIHLGFRF